MAAVALVMIESGASCDKTDGLETMAAAEKGAAELKGGSDASGDDPNW
jgi:hypothetical protein